MKKVIVVLMLVAVLLTLCSCNRKGVPIFSVGMNEWTSPDGVHYWLWRGSENSEFGLAPRYDKNGELVVDK